MKQDRLTVLRDLRPQTTLDDVWTAQEQTLVLERILTDRTTTTTRSPRRRRAAVAGAVAVGLMAVPGAATAMGDGLRPQSFFDAYSYWNENPGANGSVQAETARRVATAQGPDSAQFSVLRATNSAGTTCLAPVIEGDDSASRALPDLFTDGGSLCLDADAPPQPIGPVLVSGTDVATIWYGHAGDGRRAELRMPDGESYPVLVVDGHLFGWYPLPVRSGDAAPTLTVFGDDGTVLYRERI